MLFIFLGWEKCFIHSSRQPYLAQVLNSFFVLQLARRHFPTIDKLPSHHHPTLSGLVQQWKNLIGDVNVVRLASIARIAHFEHDRSTLSVDFYTIRLSAVRMLVRVGDVRWKLHEESR